MHSATSRAEALRAPRSRRCCARASRAYGVDLPDGARGLAGLAPPARAAGWPRRTSLCVGDAAGIDALTGEGIAVGLEHGPIAAEAIAARAATTGDFRFARYGAAIDRAVVGRELTLDGRLARCSTRRAPASCGCR